MLVVCGGIHTHDLSPSLLFSPPSQPYNSSLIVLWDDTYVIERELVLRGIVKGKLWDDNILGVLLHVFIIKFIQPLFLLSKNQF